MTKYIINFDKIKLIDYLSFFNLSKSKIYELFLNKSIKLNDCNINKDYLLKKGDILIVDFKKENKIEEYTYDIKILYEDDYILIVDKPRGFICHDDGVSGNKTVNNIIQYYYNKTKQDIIPRLVHRLDTDTTGILIYAKDMLTEAYLKENIKTDKVKRYYKAIVYGTLKKNIIIEKNIGRDRHNSKKMRISRTGKNAYTEVKVLKKFNKYTLVLCKLKTGRTHQIRVHLSSINKPIVGDKLYSNIKSKYNLMLDSSILIFFHPVLQKEITIKKELNSDMKMFMEVI